AAVVEREHHRRVVALLGAGHGAAGEDPHATPLVVLGDGAREPVGEAAAADGGFREDHGDLDAREPQRGGDLGADEAAADDHGLGAGPGEFAHAAVVVQGAVGDHA